VNNTFIIRDDIKNANIAVPTFKNEVHQLSNQARKSNTITTVLGNRYPLCKNTNDITIWNETIVLSANQLTLSLLSMIWRKFTQEGIYDRCGIVWIVADEVVFEIKENDQKTAEGIIADCMDVLSAKYRLSVPLHCNIFKYSKPSTSIRN